MKHPFFPALSLVFVLLSACSAEQPQSRQNGYIQLADIRLDKSLITRTDAQHTLSLDIKDENGGLVKHADDWTELRGESFLVPAGTRYNIVAYSAQGSPTAEGFEAQPYYLGSTSVEVRPNTAQSVEVVATLAQAKVSISYSTSMKKYLSHYEAQIEGVGAKFTADETRAAFVRAGRSLVLRLSLTPHGAQERTLEYTLVPQTKAAHHYRLRLDVDVTGTGGIHVQADPTIHEYEITLGVPLKADGLTTLPIDGDYNKVWGKKATLSALVTLPQGASVGFRYRALGQETWQSVVAKQVGQSNEYQAQVSALDLGTTYEYQVESGEMRGDVLQFTTEAYEEIPNLDFEQWTKSGKAWYPNPVADGYDALGAYWSSGNDGITSFLAGSKDPITVRLDEGKKGYGAEMHTITGIKVVGAAAGNLFIGKYKTNMRSPRNSVSFGRPYRGARPTRLSGWYKYLPAPISYRPSGYLPADRQLTLDEGHIYVKVFDAKGRQIGYGEQVLTTRTEVWTPFSFEVRYSDTSVPPAMLCIMCTSSRYGGEFVGAEVKGQLGAGSSLSVDEFVVGYD